MPKNLRDIIAERAETDGLYAVAYAITRLADVLGYSPQDTPHPLEFIGMQLKAVAEAIENLDLSDR